LTERGVQFRPTATLAALQRRAALLVVLRQFFAARGFLEVDTPLLSADTVVDRHLDPLAVTLFDDPRLPREGRTMWLQTSPEFAMKRLIAAGATAIYQVAHAFRGGESGRLHNPEFSLVEWYRVGDTMEQGIDFLSELSHAILGRGVAVRKSYAQAFQECLDIDPHIATTDHLAAVAARNGVAVPNSLRVHDRDEWLNLLLAECVEPRLGREQPTILYHYPASQAALATVTMAQHYPVAERFELYVDGLELANGYHELIDADELQRRNMQANADRVADGRYALPEGSRLLDAMRHGLPPCTGVALGFDRVVMLSLGAQSLAEAMPFPIDCA
jgi:lysyl-tRNA synthetase class 2